MSGVFGSEADDAVRLDERFHESCHMREFKIRSSDWIATLNPAAASPLPACGERSEPERSEGSG
jgi:hypothetical protein